MFNWLSLLLCFSCCSVAAQPLELFWEDLVPEGYVAPPIDLDHTANMSQQQLNAPVVDKYDNQLVKIPGFVVPLEGDAEKVTEFLLVPFFGACIHVPPPPPNQIIYVKIPQGVPIVNLSDVVWVVGILSSKSLSTELATVGYTLQGQEVLPYDG
ncbi:DUF3299 domain-containing protein [Aliiglaciecola sp. LCG003]|uniref:DUF3299 domain-containing protein n=1 Tax=Aliiglaciecola sp. LCG003 TaxID=3053655 RepID=UPI0025733B3C|nr:DUF3299 domain-containing protein [Aliiglaciecola sp. LCG003]WJG09675.1 DUF3299 domain-containing protein [Aliiglaciecola sp. LCG003]